MSGLYRLLPLASLLLVACSFNINGPVTGVNGGVNVNPTAPPPVQATPSPTPTYVGATIHGEVTRASGKSPTKLVVWIIRPESRIEVASRSPTPAGTYSFSGLDPGKYRIFVTHGPVTPGYYNSGDPDRFEMEFGYQEYPPGTPGSYYRSAPMINVNILRPEVVFPQNIVIPASLDEGVSD